MELYEKTRRAETQIARLFSTEKPFSGHLTKREDAALPDKYDHNCFVYSAQPSSDELRRALAYQRARGDMFLKLEGDAPLWDAFGMEESVTLTMALTGDSSSWMRNPAVAFHKPALTDLETLEVQNFGAVYGEDFCRRNIRRLYAVLDYHGAYLDGQLVGACYSAQAAGCTCIDGLIVAPQFRHRRVATSLLAQIAADAAGTLVFLHADAADMPKTMYEHLGFQTVDRLYEYLCVDFSILERALK